MCLLVACTCPTDAFCPDCTSKTRPVLDVVVCFNEQDLCKLNTSIRSWIQHDPLHILGSINLIWTSEHEPLFKYEGAMKQLRGLVRSSHRKLHLLDSSNQIRGSKLTPRFSQQVVNLKIAAQVKSAYYIVMEAKDTFVADISATTFLTACNQAAVYADFTWAGHRPLPRRRKIWYKNAAELFNISPPPDSLWPSPVSPMVMHRQTVLHMLAALGERFSALCDGPLCPRIAHVNETQRVTGFTTYLVYALMRGEGNCSHSLVSGGPADDDGYMTAGGVLKLAGGSGEPDSATKRLHAAKSAASGTWNVTICGFQHAALDDVPFWTRSHIAMESAKVYKRAGLYDFASLDDFARCMVGTDINGSVPLVASPWANKIDPCEPRWICAKGTKSTGMEGSGEGIRPMQLKFAVPSSEKGGSATVGSIVLASTMGIGAIAITGVVALTTASWRRAAAPQAAASDTADDLNLLLEQHATQ